MKFRIFVSAIAVVLTLTSANVFAQHSDVEFGYDDVDSPSSFVFDADEFTRDGIRIFESEMEELDPFDDGNFSSDEPGFATNAAEGLLINEGDQIFLNALDASTNSLFGVGYVNYYNPNTDALEAAGRLAIYDNSGGTADLILNGGSIESGVNQQFLGLGDSDGDLHDHVIIDLLDDSTAPLGAYGILFQLDAEFAAADRNNATDLNSDPFWIVWNHGMSEEDFESMAMPRFGVVPEPGSASLLIAATGMMMMRRRRRA